MNPVALIALVALLGIVWGLNFSLMKFAAESGIPFPLLAALTILGNLVVFTIATAVRVGRPTFRVKIWWFYLGCGLLGYLLPFFLELFSAPKIGAGPLALVVSITPIITLVVASLLGTDTVTLRRACGIGLGFVAVLPIVVQGVGDLRGIFGLGLLAGAAVPLIYALYHNFISRFWPEDLQSSEVALGETLAGALLMVPVYLATTEADAWMHIEVTRYWIVLVLVLFSAVEVLLYFLLVRLGGPIYVSQAGYITVVAGVIWGWLFFSEAVSPYLFLSMALIMLALFLVNPKKEAEVLAGDAEPTDG